MVKQLSKDLDASLTCRVHHQPQPSIASDDCDRTHPFKQTLLHIPNAEQILAFLASNPNQANTPMEFHDQPGVARGSVGAVFSRLEDREIVRHRGDYWAIAEDEEADDPLSDGDRSGWD